MKRIIPFAPLYTIDDRGNVFGPDGQKLIYEVRQNIFGDVLTVALGDGDDMRWHSVIDLVSTVHFDGDRIVYSSGAKIGYLSLLNSNIGFPPQKHTGFVSLSAFAKDLPSQAACVEIWYQYQDKDKSISEIHKDVKDKLGTSVSQSTVSIVRSVVRAALMAGIRE